MREELAKNGYVSTVQTIQRHPFIMSLKVSGHSCHLLGQGTTENDAMIDLFQTTKSMFIYGYNFRRDYE